jgi:hypothetical protein
MIDRPGGRSRVKKNHDIEITASRKHHEAEKSGLNL